MHLCQCPIAPIIKALLKRPSNITEETQSWLIIINRLQPVVYLWIHEHTHTHTHLWIWIFSNSPETRSTAAETPRANIILYNPLCPVGHLKRAAPCYSGDIRRGSDDKIPPPPFSLSLKNSSFECGYYILWVYLSGFLVRSAVYGVNRYRTQQEASFPIDVNTSVRMNMNQIQPVCQSMICI